MMKKVCPLFFLLAATAGVNAQDLTGIWRGHFRSSEVYERLGSTLDDRYKMEVQIAQQKTGFQAVTYSYLSTVFYGKATASGTLNPSSKKVLLKELKIVEIRMSVGDACVMTCFLQYSKLGDEEFLEGTYTSMNARDSTGCGKGTIFLHKVQESDFGKEPFLEKREKEIERENHKITESPTAPPRNAHSSPATVSVSKKAPVRPYVPKPVSKTDSASKKSAALVKNTPAAHRVERYGPRPRPVAQTEISIHNNHLPTVHTDSLAKIEKKLAPVLVVPKVLTSRQNELVKTITVNTNEIELDIYDDGAIDNDTVSVYVDKKNVIYHAMLTDRPIIVKLHMDESNDFHEVVMVAENEGEIPPNTSLMVVKAGDKEYEVRIVSTEQKNAIVIFKFEK